MDFIIFGILTVCFAIFTLYAVVGTVKCLFKSKWIGFIAILTLTIILINCVINFAEKVVI